MAIGRVAGPLLYSDLDRQGVDLQFSTSNQPLLYLDFANFRAAINTDTLNTTATFTVNGNAVIDGLSINSTTISSDAGITLDAAGDVRIGHISALKITGGTNNYIMTTDGNGNLSWQNLNAVADELNLSATNINLGTTTDGSVVDYSAYRYWTPATTIADAIDNLNQVMLNVYQDTYVGRAEFTANIVAGPSPITVSFTSTIVGNPTEYLWEFGDGLTSTAKDPVHTFSNELGGQYTVYFKASNPAGTRSAQGRLGDGHLAQGSYADSLKPDFITLYTPLPVSAFTLDAVSMDSGSTVQLTNLSQYGTSYIVYWGDGTATTVTSNTLPGSPGNGPVSHTYTNAGGDATYQVTLETYSATAGPGGATVSSSPTTIRVYSAQTPQFNANKVSGNNQHNTPPYGLNVIFTNTTGTNPGPALTFPGNHYRWVWGDGTTTDVAVGSNTSGDTSLPITHAFLLDDPKVEQTFIITLELYTGYSTSPFVSVTRSVTVIPAPTSVFDAVFITPSDRIGDTPQIGYEFLDLLGRNRAAATYTNSSINADTYRWTLGDGTTLGPLPEGDTGSPTGPALNHTYANQGPFSVTLLAHGPSSLSASDDTLAKSNYLTVLPPPAPPAGLGAKTISLTNVGLTPFIVAGATTHTVAAQPTPGTTVTRITTVNPVATTSAEDAYNADTGDLFAIINGTPEAIVPLTGADETGTYGSLVVTADHDAHVNSPSIYPSSFYTVVSAHVSRPAIAVAVGVNSYQISHSLTGSTNRLTFVKDDVTLPPTLDATAATATTTTFGTPRFISGVPYFNTSGIIAISNVTAYNWIGQTYIGTPNPLTAMPITPAVEGSGAIIITQGKTYAEIDRVGGSFLAAGIPMANTGKDVGSPYTLGAIPVEINALVAATGRVSLALSNVNGDSAIVTVPTLINVYAIPIIGFDETDIPVSPTLGGAFTDNGKRIFIAGATGANPGYSSIIDYYSVSPFVGSINIEGTDEAVVRFGTLAPSLVDFSSYLPVGPNLSSRNSMFAQFFRFSFHRTLVANFTITYSGKISGIHIAAPGTAIDNTSTLNGWLDASIVYAGAGTPGANTGVGGNGSNGCAKTSGDKVPTGNLVTNHSCTLTLGNENSSNAYMNEILVSIVLNTGDSITAISIS